MTKYRRLFEHLCLAGDGPVEMSFDDVGQLVGGLPVSAEDPVERLEGLLVWFWPMYGSLTRDRSRQLDQAAEQVRLLDGVLALALNHVGDRHEPVSGEPLAALQVMADRMDQIHPALETAGVTSPDTAKARHSLGLAAELLHAGWRP